MGLHLFNLLPLEWLEALSKKIMDLGYLYRENSETGYPLDKRSTNYFEGYIPYQGRLETYGGGALDTYLLPKDSLKKVLLKRGYIEGTPGDYGLVRKAVGNRDIPVYLTSPDYTKRENLTVIGNYDLGYSDDSELYHAGNHPGAIYITSDGKLVTKKWDLNDYGESSAGNTGAHYNKINLWLVNTLDKIGSPIVVTSGFLPLRNPTFKSEEINTNKHLTLDDVLNNKSLPISDLIIDAVKNFAKTHNLQNYDGQWILTLPEVIITPKHKNGNKLIPKKRFIK